MSILFFASSFALSRLRGAFVLRSRATVAMLCILLFASVAQADVKMPGLFGDHMVLQQGQKIPVWGWADAGEKVTVTLGSQSLSIEASAAGKWRVDLAKLQANHQPQELTISGKNTLKFEDVLVGEVWICSGQSNMQYGIQGVKGRPKSDDGELRVFCLTKSASLTPMDDTTFVPKELVYDTKTGHWSKTPDAGTWNGFSAVGYLFGQRIREITGNPVGLIGSYWGGTPAQAWTSLSGLQKEPVLSNYVNTFQKLTDAQKARFPIVWADYVAAMRKWTVEVYEPDQLALRKWQAAVKTAQARGTTQPAKPEPTGKRPADPGNEGTPTTLFNGMINPLLPYAFKGVIWYQGESNAYNAREYATLFSAMIRDWRDKFQQGDFPFLFVQLAGYGAKPGEPDGGHWAELREAQSKALALNNTGMATAVDIGEEKDIHPKNKVDVANRLALLAENRVYGKHLLDAGPTYDSMKIEAHAIRVSFQNVGSGLMIAAPPVLPGATTNPVPTELTGFEIAGADQKWQPAKATVDGNSVVVQGDAVTDPIAVRYAWADFPSCSLYNREGLPAFPFRTDDWK